MVNPDGGRRLEQALDDLYGAPSSEFVATRATLAAALRSDGCAAEARTLMAARRPTTAAGALNRVVRESPAVVGLFLDSIADLRDAYSRSREDVRAATTEYRDAQARLIQAACASIARPSDSSRAQIATTLHAASLDDDVAALLRVGRLVKEVSGPTGFGDGPVLVAVPDAARAERSTAKTRPAAETAADRKRADRERAAAAVEEQRQAKLRARLAQVRAELATAGRALADTRERVQSLETDLFAARREVHELQGRVERSEVEAAELEQQVRD